MERYFVMWNGAAWFVKHGDLFMSQGGNDKSWGRNWRPLYADSVEHARDRARLEYGEHGERFLVS